MRLRFLAVSAGLLLTVPAFASTPRVHRGPTAPHVSRTKASASAKPKTTAVRGIDPERATQIQTALIKAGYMNGTPSGVWDAQSEAAMQKMQADNGWQTKLVPDSRAIIKLGLGPNSQAEVIAPEAGVPAEAKVEVGQPTVP